MKITKQLLYYYFEYKQKKHEPSLLLVDHLILMEDCASIHGQARNVSYEELSLQDRYKNAVKWLRNKEMKRKKAHAQRIDRLTEKAKLLCKMCDRQRKQNQLLTQLDVLIRSSVKEQCL